MTVVDCRIRRTLDGQNAGQPALDSGKSVIEQGVVAGDFCFELGNDRAAGWHGYRLNAFERGRLQATQQIDLVENRADDMER